MLDVYTRNGSRVTANTAGIESSAKIRSLISMTTSATRSGVAKSRPRWRTSRLELVVTGVIGIKRPTQLVQIAQLASTSLVSFSLPQSMRTAANTNKAANG